MATVSLSQYLWRRIREVGIQTVMGLPGDFQLELLDEIYNVDGLRFAGNGNELNAAYAADGYARIKNVPGCLCTTHGVGELSAINGIAGAMTEQVKIIHIVGQTKRSMQMGRQMIHHSIGFQPDHHVYSKVSHPFRVAAAELQDVRSAPYEIDRVIRACFLKSGPVYIFFPLDMVEEQVPAKLLDEPIDLSLPMDETVKATMEAASNAIIGKITEAKNPVVLVDGLIHRHNAIAETKALLEKLGFPIYSTQIGKGIIDETHPLSVGVYSGAVSGPDITDTFEASDLILVFGHLPADTNTGNFSQKCPPEKTISFAPDSVEISGFKSFARVFYKDFLPFLTKKVEAEKLPKVTVPKFPAYELDNTPESQVINANWFWPYMVNFLQPKDVVIGETGTALFGLQDLKFPSEVSYISQTYYGSIGYATPAAFGADMALRDLASSNEPRRRTVLITGDGSMQLTIQEVGSMIHHGAAPVIVVINNAGYTIERAIHGAKAAYNDIAPYNWAYTLRLFGMSEEEATSHYVKCATRAEFEKVCRDDRLRKPDRPYIVEVVMEALDAPWRMLQTIALRGPEVAAEMEDGGFTLVIPKAVAK